MNPIPSNEAENRDELNTPQEHTDPILGRADSPEGNVSADESQGTTTISGQEPDTTPAPSNPFATNAIREDEKTPEPPVGQSEQAQLEHTDTLDTVFEATESTEEEQELESVEDMPDVSALGKTELVQLAVSSVKEKEPAEATRILNAIRPVLEQLVLEEHSAALAKFLEEGGEKDDFEFKDDSREQFNRAYKELRQKKSDERARQESEKLANLKKKEEILDQIRELTETEETRDSLKRLKELQTEWKNVRNVPKEKVETLWDNYHALITRFYDRLSMFNELKDLDRRKNLDQKIDLTKKVTELALEPNIKKALILLKKYQEDWRVIGPVPQESNEDIWNRFRQECDKIYEMIKAYQAEQDRKREENLAEKKSILAKAYEFSNFTSNKIKDWIEKTTASNQLMEEWKKVGPVPMKEREVIWNDFKNARNIFFNNKNTFFKKLHTERAQNLKVKTALCEKAEAIAANPIDWNKQTEEVKRLQEEWKKSGPVHEKISDAIWKRFRGACDAFFSKKAEHFAGQVEEQKKNLEIKNSIIARLEELFASSDESHIIPRLKAIQEEWNTTGFVPMNAKEAVNRKYNELTDKVFNKFKQASAELRESREQSHLEALANSPNGQARIRQEEKYVMDKIRGLRNDIDTWENNLGFFSKGNKGENPMVEQIKGKIEQARKTMTTLETKLKTIRKFARQKPTA
jgi:hypothetical protein